MEQAAAAAAGNVEVESNVVDNVCSNKFKPEVEIGNDNTQTLASVQVHVHNNNISSNNNNNNTVLEPVAPLAEKCRPDFQADVEVYVPEESSGVVSTNINDIINGTFCILIYMYLSTPLCS